jgi:hypothetical protein
MSSPHWIRIGANPGVDVEDEADVVELRDSAGVLG